MFKSIISIFAILFISQVLVAADYTCKARGHKIFVKQTSPFEDVLDSVLHFSLETVEGEFTLTKLEGFITIWDDVNSRDVNNNGKIEPIADDQMDTFVENLKKEERPYAHWELKLNEPEPNNPYKSKKKNEKYYRFELGPEDGAGSRNRFNNGSFVVSKDLHTEQTFQARFPSAQEHGNYGCAIKFYTCEEDKK